ncbi:MAG: putative toxin-antitoxin system toxin component, PIN family [Bacillota bacterium]|nr:putative toxin-antitoxin system toxin component, PIN family [Bacillota bacterium]
MVRAEVRAVLDTNVLLSALIFPGGPPDKAFRLAMQRRYTLLTSDFILEELERVLRLKFGLLITDTAAEIVPPAARLHVVEACDGDNRILECAVDGRASHLVTGDRKHLYPLRHFEGIRIVLPSEFLGIIGY